MLQKLRPFQRKIRKKLEQLKHAETNTRQEKEAIHHICELAKKGKLIRGSMILYLASLHQEEPPYSLGAAYEILHTGLLIHDDVIDEDDIRRDVKSTRSLYATDKTQKYGDNQAICVGDIALFYGMEKIVECEATNRDIIVQLLKQFRTTGGGQMLDIEITDSEVASKEDILSMYKYKTAHYTFTTPLLLGLKHNQEISKTTEKDIEILGEKLGVLFQLRDDYLAYTPKKKTGKTKYNDVREDKKTVIRTVLEKENPAVKDLYGKKDLSKKDKELLEETFNNVKSTYMSSLRQKEQQILEIINRTEFEDHLKKEFRQLTRYLCTRTK